MTEFIDPRSDPEPPARVSREPAAHGEELQPLVKLCLEGRIYEAERWIREGHPIQALSYKRPKKPAVTSPLRAAIRRKHRDLVLLLLCNGYRLSPEDGPGSLLDEAFGAGALEIADLLLKWGADPAAVEVENVLDTYRTELIEEFWRAGLDYTADSGFPSYLARTVNKPLYGWMRRNRSADPRLQDALDVALLEAVEEGQRELPVRLLLWAGADPHRKVPLVRDLCDPDAWTDSDLWSASEAAILYGRHELLGHLRIGALPDLESQAARAHDTRTLKAVVDLRPPSDWSPVILAFTRKMCWRYFGGSTWDAREALRFIESQGGRLTVVPAEEFRYLRSQLVNVPSPDDFSWLLRWLRKAKNCEPAIFAELTRTPAMREKMRALAAGERFLTTSQKMSRANDRRRRAAERRQRGSPSVRSEPDA